MNTAEYLHYRVGEYRTLNKLDAIEKANGDITKVKFYFCDEEHKSYDWSKEPSASIHQLIDQRVIELRTKYKHVCLWYSGGFDSHTILNSFIRTNTRLDEVLIYGKPWIKDPGNTEHVFAFEFIKKIKQKLQPWLKITQVTIQDQIHTNFYQKYKSEWIYHDPLNYFSYIKASRGIAQLFQPEYKNLVHDHNRVDICGVDKPRVDLRDGKWYASVPDTSLNAFFGSYYDLFYLCPEATEIYIKQCWNVINWFESLPQCTHEFVHEVQSHKHPLLYAEWNKFSGRDDVYHSVAHNGYAKKFYGTGVNSLDSLMYENQNKNAEEELFKMYQIGLTYLETKYSNLWSRDKGWPTINSTPIYIKDFQKLSNTKA
jgi:hypothetical protein